MWAHYTAARGGGCGGHVENVPKPVSFLSYSPLHAMTPGLTIPSEAGRLRPGKGGKTVRPSSLNLSPGVRPEFKLSSTMHQHAV